MDSVHSKDKKPIKFVKRQVPEHPYCTNWPMSEEKNNKDFIGIFPNAASKEYCEKVIARFEYIRESQSAWGNTGRQKIWSRQEAENGIPKTLKEDDTYFLGDSPGDVLPLEEEVMSTDMPLLKEFSELSFNCYKLYAEKYGILTTLSPHKMSIAVKIQKTKKVRFMYPRKLLHKIEY